MYPLNLTKKLPEGAGFAVANTEDEHKALSEMGYEPKFVAPEPVVSEIDQVRAQLDAAGIEYDKRMGLEKLKALLPAA